MKNKIIKLFIRLFVKNVRMGLATNSSSSHSLVFARPNEDVKREYGPKGKWDAESDEYGWGWFKLHDLYSKLNYAIVQLVGQGQGYWGQVDKESVDEKYEQYGYLFPEFTKESWYNAARGYVDHQSQTTDIVELVNDLRREDVIVYGGNDNDNDYGPESLNRKYIGW